MEVRTHRVAVIASSARLAQTWKTGRGGAGGQQNAYRPFSGHHAEPPIRASRALLPTGA